MMWHTGQRIRCTNDRFSGAVWEWTSAVPEAGCLYTIAAFDRLPQWNTRTPILCFLLLEMKKDDSNTFFSSWRFEPVDNTPSWIDTAHAIRYRTPPTFEL
jgi:hypothetical protein